MVNYYEKVKANPEIFKQLTCKELLFVHYNCPFEVSKTDKWSQHNYFLYILSGKAAYHTPDRSWLLTRGSGVFIKKGGSIIEKFFEEVLCIITFFVPDSYLRSFMRENLSLVQKNNLPAVTNELVIQIEVNEILTAYIESVLPYFYSEKKPSEDLLELKFRELLLNLIINPANCDLNTYAQSLISPLADNLQQVMEANCLYNLTLHDYAKLCNRSLSSFKRDFTEVYKATPGHWLLNKKLDYARKLLLTSTKPINDIAFESGFENSTHFSRVFKERFDASPLQYRKKATHSIFPEVYF